MKEKIILASQNHNKAREFDLALSHLAYEVLCAKDSFEVEESGKSFAENALIKAIAYSKVYNLPALADDSGLCVDALQGAPGIYSARYASVTNSISRDAENNKKLLSELKLFSSNDRTAHFVCSLALVFPKNERFNDFQSLNHPNLSSNEDFFIISVEGYAFGRILEAPRGENGFGYDPLFYHEVLGKTFAEMSSQEKLKVSHRGKAIEELCTVLSKLDCNSPILL